MKVLRFTHPFVCKDPSSAENSMERDMRILTVVTGALLILCGVYAFFKGLGRSAGTSQALLAMGVGSAFVVAACFKFEKSQRCIHQDDRSQGLEKDDKKVEEQTTESKTSCEFQLLQDAHNRQDDRSQGLEKDDKKVEEQTTESKTSYEFQLLQDAHNRQDDKYLYEYIVSAMNQAWREKATDNEQGKMPDFDVAMVKTLLASLKIHFENASPETWCIMVEGHASFWVDQKLEELSKS